MKKGANKMDTMINGMELVLCPIFSVVPLTMTIPSLRVLNLKWNHLQSLIRPISIMKGFSTEPKATPIS
jgi:hypothetical protein